MKFTAIVYQNNPKKIHGDVGRVNLFGLRHDYEYEEKKVKK